MSPTWDVSNGRQRVYAAAIGDYGEESSFSICFYSTIIFLISAKLINSTEVNILFG